MSQIILDFGSGNTCRNDVGRVREMIDALAEVDSRKHDVTIKFQLFESALPNTPLSHDTFTEAAIYALAKGYKTTASVFDKESMGFLRLFDVPFIKIACRPDLYWLSLLAPCVPIYTSWPGTPVKSPGGAAVLACARKYPATLADYEERFESGFLHNAISDHTTDFYLFKQYHPEIYECHFKLPDSEGPDAGPFARTPEQLKEIL